MKTFKQYLTEAQVKNIVDLLKRDCQPFLTASNNGWVQRGISNLDGVQHIETLDGQATIPYYKKEVRKDRKPVDISETCHKVIDEWFNEKFGFKARSNVCFVKGYMASGTSVSQYGRRMVIFPIGEIKYVWSPQVGDLYVYLGTFAESNDEDMLREKAIPWLEEQGYQNTDLDKAVKLREEIMIGCSSYYAFPFAYIHDIKEALEELS